MCLSGVLQLSTSAAISYSFAIVVLCDHTTGRLIGFFHPLLCDGLYFLGDDLFFGPFSRLPGFSAWCLSCVCHAYLTACLLPGKLLRPYCRGRHAFAACISIPVDPGSYGIDARYGIAGPRYGEYYGIVQHRSWRSKTVVPKKSATVKTALRYRSGNFSLAHTVSLHFLLSLHEWYCYTAMTHLADHLHHVQPT